MPAFTIVCRGARGSVPVSGESFRRYGGATTCFEIPLKEDHRLLIDAGTGALSLNEEPLDKAMRFSVLLTHFHWDHTLALPFFKPLYQRGTRVDFYGHRVLGMDIEEAIDTVMRPPWFPVSFRSAACDKHFIHLDGQEIEIEGVRITPVRLNHPQGVTAYRLEREGKTLVVATDVEHGDQASDEELLALARGADLLIYDAQYLPDEYEGSKVGWGHSTWKEAVDLAERAGVRRLLLTSHDPGRHDDEIDEILASARTVFPATDAAYEGMKITI